MADVERKLAAIMFTDIVGYTALMAESEERGLGVRERNRTVVRPFLGKYHAERIEETERRAIAAAELNEEFEGDSLSAEFQALEFHGSADQQLLELKSKMGVLKAGEAPKQLGDGDDDVSEAEVLEEGSDQPPA